MVHDVPYPGAREFVDAIWRAGYQIVYLTGRDMARSYEGTLASLTQWNFPVAERTDIILKPRFRWSMSDVDFKNEAAQSIANRHQVVCAIDNEPENLHAFAKYFPVAEIVLFHSIMSPRVPEESIAVHMGNRVALGSREFLIRFQN